MSDQIPQVSGQPAPAAGQQAAGHPGNTAPEGFVEQARFNGSVRKVEELTLANRELTVQLTQRASEIEQLRGQLGIKDVEKQVAVSERDTRLTDALKQVSTLQDENKVLKALEAKVKIAKELNRPDLLKIADRIPYIEDAEALKTVMLDFARFADEAVKAREDQLLAGIGPSLGPGSGGPAAPASSQAWLQEINAAGIGTPERKKLMDGYGDWLEAQNK